MQAAAQLFFEDPKLFWMKTKGRFSNSYFRLHQGRDILLFGLVFSCYCKAILGKKTLKTAYAGRALFPLTEALEDFGFFIEDPFHSIFEGYKGHPLYPYNPLISFKPENFDVILVGDYEKKKRMSIQSSLEEKNCLVLDLERMAYAFRVALGRIKSRHFFSCLNVHKLASIALALSFCPSCPTILEAGAYQCGTTIFMAKFLKALGKSPTIFALDTFEGIPKAWSEDKKDKFVFDAGQFTEVCLKEVQKRIRKENLQQEITLVPGYIQDTLPLLLEKKEDISFLFLDTDQYAGTKEVLTQILPICDEKLLILIDDAKLTGVDQAIRESLAAFPTFTRKDIVSGVDLLFNMSGKEVFSYVR